MKSTVENVSSVERKIIVEIEPERVKAELDKAYKTLGAQVKVEGFRPGKVPRHVLERKFKGKIEADVAQNLVEQSYREVVLEKNLEVVAAPTVAELPAVDVLKTFTYQARVEVKPVIEPKDYLGLTVKRGKHEVAEKDVDDELGKIRQQQSQLVPVTGRKAEKGDLGVIDFEALVDGKGFPGNKAESTTVEVADGEFINGQVGQVEGLEVGGTKTFDYHFPADFRVAEAAGKDAKISITLKELKKRELPALDDELAKDAGVASLAELKAKVKESLDARAKAEKERETRDAVIKGLVAANPFECPAAMIERGVEMMFENSVRRLIDQGIDPRQLGLDLRSWRDSLRPKAEEEVRGSLLLEAVAKKENIKATEADAEAEMGNIAKDNNMSLADVKKAYRNRDNLEGLIARVREERTLTFLTEKAKVEET
jgi:trigger factor